ISWLEMCLPGFAHPGGKALQEGFLLWRFRSLQDFRSLRSFFRFRNQVWYGLALKQGTFSPAVRADARYRGTGQPRGVTVWAVNHCSFSRTEATAPAKGSAALYSKAVIFSFRKVWVKESISISLV